MTLELDTQGIWDVTVALPDQVEVAAGRAHGVVGLPAHEDVEHVVVMGMGGSGIAGDILQAAAAPFMPVPVVVVKGYECPHFVGEGSLVFAVSFSGNTEETLQAATEAAVNGRRSSPSPAAASWPSSHPGGGPRWCRFSLTCVFHRWPRSPHVTAAVTSGDRAVRCEQWIPRRARSTSFRAAGRAEIVGRPVEQPWPADSDPPHRRRCAMVQRPCGDVATAAWTRDATPPGPPPGCELGQPPPLVWRRPSAH